jgi:hypothetical protein
MFFGELFRSLGRYASAFVLWPRFYGLGMQAWYWYPVIGRH